METHKRETYPSLTVLIKTEEENPLNRTINKNKNINFRVNAEMWQNIMPKLQQNITLKCNAMKTQIHFY